MLHKYEASLDNKSVYEAMKEIFNGLADHVMVSSQQMFIRLERKGVQTKKWRVRMLLTEMEKAGELRKKNVDGKVYWANAHELELPQ